MQASNIKKIERIQNCILWRVFSNEAEDIKLKNNGETNIDFLFCGTRFIPPSVIYENREGFKLNYAHEGMWGRANYFAYNS